ncbi:MAG: hypothetical protein PHU76_01585 [Synergistaceae bacterium]|nr:hypothetical protein [Proteiniphilum sp.]MDD3963131.1 hypothetical protein [Synergistaceae bacterium]
MPDDVSIELWMDRRRLAALDKALSHIGYDKGAEKYMQDRFIDTYAEIVPTDIQSSIDTELAAELLADKRLAEEQQRICAFHVTENGQSQYFSVDEGLELLDAAKKLRSYLTAEPVAKPDCFEKMFLHPAVITAEKFDELAVLRMDNTGKVTGVFDVDFDKHEFSGVHIMNGWKTYALGDISTAAYRATHRRLLSRDEQYEKLFDYLDGKELTSAGHLSARELSFEDEICEMDERLNFMLNGGFDVDAVFDTFVVTDQNDDWLNIYANYDMPSGKVCDTLDIVLHRGDGSDEELSYTLNAAEKEVVRRAMNDYCIRQTGMTLADYSAQCMEENDAPLMEPQM